MIIRRKNSSKEEVYEKSLPRCSDANNCRPMRSKSLALFVEFPTCSLPKASLITLRLLASRELRESETELAASDQPHLLSRNG